MYLGAALVIGLAALGCKTTIDNPANNKSRTSTYHAIGWNVVDSTNFHGIYVNSHGYNECTECHGIMTYTGSSGVNCLDCHVSYPGCTGCHGGKSDGSGAPPYGLNRDSLPTDLAVGAHAVHIHGATFSDGVLCQSCHNVPVALGQPGHMDDEDIAEVQFSGLSGAQGIWTRTSATCGQTYCHGNFDGGKSSNTPVWTAPGSVACGSCHDTGADPESLGWKHEAHINIAGLKCFDCHYNIVDANLNVIDRALHVNGAVDTMTRDTALCAICHNNSPSGCVVCHGGVDNQTGAPPKGLRGETATSQLAVGAHSVHLAGGSISNGFACRECHLVPASIISAGHLGVDSIAEMTWGSTTGPVTSWSRTTGRCANSYCHGNFTGGTKTNAPLWTGTNQAACGTCHDVGATPSLLSGRHRLHVSEEQIGCYECHNTTVNSSNAIIGKSVHINRENTVQFLEGGTYSNHTCSNIACHDSDEWY